MLKLPAGTLTAALGLLHRGAALFLALQGWIPQLELLHGL